MKTTKKVVSLFSLIAAVMFAASTFAAEAGEIRGQLVSLDSQQSSITVKAEVLGISGPEKKDLSFNLQSDAKWTVCLNGQCAEKTGIEGFRLVNEYATFEAYGISPKGCNVTLYQSGSSITGVRVNIC